MPVIVRPSWVIGGRGIAVLSQRGRCRPPCWRTEIGWPLRVDEMVAGVELDVDAISDGTDWCVPGILEQLDPPGVHSGDSVAVVPPQSLSRERQEAAAEAAGRIALALGLRGILNVQMIVSGDRVVVIEANPRASRTVPIVAKATGRDVVADAVRCALGASLADVGLAPGLAPDSRAGGRQGTDRLALALARRGRGARPGDAVDRRGAGPGGWLRRGAGGRAPGRGGAPAPRPDGHGAGARAEHGAGRARRGAVAAPVRRVPSRDGPRRDVGRDSRRDRRDGP